ncbi:MAG: methylmalonyl Co-A mutase-associated GTPase MeaB [Steroidobacteraceae bacterium]
MKRAVPLDPAAIAAKILRGDRRLAGRLITQIDNGDPCAAEVLALLFPHTGRARVIGITGPPGAGKSTLVAAVVGNYRATGKSVGVVAVDPSSPFTGGALLGDRIRMNRHATDPGVFIRSMASRGCLGGVALATPGTVRVLDAMGLDVVVVETVGAGQSEVGVMDIADCTILVTMPSGGDAIQMLKAGIMEIGDIFVVNKSDLAGADRAAREIVAMLHLSDDERAAAPVLLTSAREGIGIAELVAVIEAHIAAAEASGALADARLHHLQREALAWAAEHMRQRIRDALETSKMEELIAGLRARRIDPTEVGRRMLAASRSALVLMPASSNKEGACRTSE